MVDSPEAEPLDYNFETGGPVGARNTPPIAAPRGRTHPPSHSRFLTLRGAGCPIGQSLGRWAAGGLATRTNGLMLLAQGAVVGDGRSDHADHAQTGWGLGMSLQLINGRVPWGASPLPPVRPDCPVPAFRVQVHGMVWPRQSLDPRPSCAVHRPGGRAGGRAGCRCPQMGRPSERAAVVVERPRVRAVEHADLPLLPLAGGRPGR